MLHTKLFLFLLLAAGILTQELQSTSQPDIQTNTQAATEISTQQNTQPSTQPDTQPDLEYTTEPSTQPDPEFTTQPTTQPYPEFTTQPTTQPDPEFTKQPATQPDSEYTTQLSTQPNTEQHIQPSTPVDTQLGSTTASSNVDPRESTVSRDTTDVSTEPPDPCQFLMCENSGTCSVATTDNVEGGGGAGTAYCVCSEGYTGDTCAEEVDDCVGIVCGNEGQCIDLHNDYSCNCTQYWTGSNCTEDIDECDLDTHTCDRTHGSCNNIDNGYTCACDEGYEGNNDNTQCTFIAHCDTSPCKHDVYCTNLLNGYRCYCDNGWTGDNCDIDVNECEGRPDLCGSPVWGECMNADGGYTCHCKPGASLDQHGVCTEDKIVAYIDVEPYTGDEDVITTPLVTPMPAYGERHRFIQVHKYYGVVGLGIQPDSLLDSSPYPRTDRSFPNNGRTVVAPYWTVLSEVEALYIKHYSVYANTTSHNYNLYTRMRDMIRREMSEPTYEPIEVVAYTWHGAKRNDLPNNMELPLTFQCILTTDGTMTYITYNYDSTGSSSAYIVDLLEANITPVVVGVSNGRGHQSTLTNNEYSETATWKRQYFTLHSTTTPDDTSSPDNDLNCYDYHLLRDTYTMSVGASVPTCPCTREHAQADGAWVYSEETMCATYRFTVCQANVRCCYHSSGALLTYTTAEAATQYLSLVYQSTDAECGVTGTVTLDTACQPNSQPAQGLAWGYGHLLTFDSYQYMFGLHGEFTLVRITNDTSRLLELQVRMSYVNDASKDSFYYSAVAMQWHNTPAIQAQLTDDRDDIEVTIGDAPEQVLTLSTMSSVRTMGDCQLIPEQPYVHADQGSVTRDQQQSAARGKIIIQCRYGYGVEVILLGDRLAVMTSIPQAVRTDTSLHASGLMGIYSGSDIIDNEFTMNDDSDTVFTDPNSDGTVTQQELASMAATWQVTATTSLFMYTDSETYANINDNTQTTTEYHSDIVTDMSIPEDCEGISSCVIDYSISSSNAIAISSKQLQQTFVNMRQWTENTAPVLSEEQFYQETIQILPDTGTPITVQLSAVDGEGQQITWTVQTNMQTVTLDGDTLTLGPYTSAELQALYSSPTPTSDTKLHLHVVATGSAGARSVWLPDVTVCGCAQGCKQSVPYHLCTDQFYFLPCNCTAAQSGQFCTSSRDLCDAGGYCYPGVDCTTDQQGEEQGQGGSSAGYSCGQCPQFYEADDTGRHACTPKNMCVDSGCADTCMMSLVASSRYECRCPNGQVLAEDQHNCTVFEPCSAGEHDCTGEGQYCYSDINTFNCVCRPEYFTNPEGGICTRAPYQYRGRLTMEAVIHGDSVIQWNSELADHTSTQYNQASQAITTQIDNIFKSLYGSYVGSRITNMSEGSISVYFDIYMNSSVSGGADEMNSHYLQALRNSNCTSNAQDCSLGAISAIDQERSGIQAKSFCQHAQDNTCNGVSSECMDTQHGSYECQCKEGFESWLGKTEVCADIDECSRDLDVCNTTTSTCTNLLGGYTCTCKPGYRLNDTMDDSHACVEVCDPNPCFNGGVCKSVAANSYVCHCEGQWRGLHCEKENDEYEDLKSLTIGIGAGLGVICLVMLLVMCVMCVRICFGRTQPQPDRMQHRSHTFTADNEVRMESQPGEYARIGAPTYANAGSVGANPSNGQRLLMQKDGQMIPLGVDNPTYSAESQGYAQAKMQQQQV